MSTIIKSIFFRMMFLYDWFSPFVHQIEFYNWLRHGRPFPPPPRYKQLTVMQYGRHFALKTLIETGTYLGDMAYATRNTFKHILTIELDHNLHERAKRRLARYPHIVPISGNSAEVLPQILSKIYQPCLFWLDAHFSGGFTARSTLETPIVGELNIIMNHPISNHVILIDDAHEFTGQHDYPPLGELRDFLLSIRPAWTFIVEDNIIRFYPPQIR